LNDVVFGDGELDRLAEILVGYPDPVLVVGGETSYVRSGAAERIERQMRDREWDHFVVRARLPGMESAREAVLGGRTPGVIVAVGGGAVLDIGKLIALAFTNGTGDELLASKVARPAIDLVAIPTTAGSGSERTPFAVAYRGVTKFSVSHPSLLPRLAIVDPTLTYSLPAGPTAASGLDVVAHAIESAWSGSATVGSVCLSLEALECAWASIMGCVTTPNPENRRTMAEASTKAGSAIAIARTTASHALSYYLTAVHGVPHGVAAALTLGAVLVFNSEVDEASVRGTRDPGEIRSTIGSLCAILGAVDAAAAMARIEERMRAIGVPTRLSEVGVRGGAVDEMAGSVNAERLSNNPRHATREDLIGILTQVA
jgi:alcohol dehydrogenase class IV